VKQQREQGKEELDTEVQDSYIDRDVGSRGVCTHPRSHRESFAGGGRARDKRIRKCRGPSPGRSKKRGNAILDDDQERSPTWNNDRSASGQARREEG
jgi:hypothetical protein